MAGGCVCACVYVHVCVCGAGGAGGAYIGWRLCVCMCVCACVCVFVEPEALGGRTFAGGCVCAELATRRASMLARALSAARAAWAVASLATTAFLLVSPRPSGMATSGLGMLASAYGDDSEDEDDVQPSGAAGTSASACTSSSSRSRRRKRLLLVLFGRCRSRSGPPRGVRIGAAPHIVAADRGAGCDRWVHLVLELPKSRRRGRIWLVGVAAGITSGKRGLSSSVR